MRNPLAAWRAGVRWPLATLGLVAALVVVDPGLRVDRLAVPGRAGPTLAGEHTRPPGRVQRRGGRPERRARRPARRRARHGAADRDRRSRRGARQPHMLLARDARLRLGYLDLWRAWRGEPLRISGARGAASSTPPSSAAPTAGPRGSSASRPPATMPRATTLAADLRQARVSARAVSPTPTSCLPASIEADFALERRQRAGRAAALPASSASDAPRGIFVRAGGAARALRPAAAAVALAPGERGLRLNAIGQYRKLPARIELRTSRRPRLAGRGQRGDGRSRCALTASVGRANLSFDGTTTDPLHFAGLKGSFVVSGAVARHRSAIPSASPCRPRRRSRPAARWSRTAACGRRSSTRRRIGSEPPRPAPSPTRAGARCRCSPAGSPARAWCWPTSARSSARRATGDPPGRAGTTAAGERVIPDRKFDLPSLRAMDANVLIDIAMFDPGTTVIEPLRPVRAHLLLANGVLTLADFEGRTAQGRLVGYLQLDGRGKEALWTADLRVLGVDLAHWLRLKRSDAASPPYVCRQARRAGEGEGLGPLDRGDPRQPQRRRPHAHVREASISHLVIEMLGLDVAQALGLKLTGDKALPILCNVVDLDIAGGVAKPKVFVAQHHRLHRLRRRLGLAQDRGDGPSRRRLAEGLQPADAAHADPRPRHPRRSGGVDRGRQGWSARPRAATLLASWWRRSRRSCPSSIRVAGCGQGDGAALRRAGRHQRQHLGGDAGAQERRRCLRPRAGGAAGGSLSAWAPASSALVADELAFALRVRLADLLGLLHLFGLLGRPGAASRAAGSTLPDSAKSRPLRRSAGRLRSRLRPGPGPAWGLGCHRVSPGWWMPAGMARSGGGPVLDDLVGDDVEAQQAVRAEAHRDRHVAGVAAARHDDAADAARGCGGRRRCTSGRRGRPRTRR